MCKVLLHSARKDSKKFVDVQILTGKSFKSFMGDLGFREKEMPFMRICINGKSNTKSL